MSVLRGIERTIEGLFEGVFGRAFRAHVQPVELARKLAKEMDEGRSVSVSRVYAPNEYTVFLSVRDRAQFASYEGSLIGELQEYLMEHARREGYALLTPARVIITTDEALAIGEFGIAARVVPPEEHVVASAPAALVPPIRREPASVGAPPVTLPPPKTAEVAPAGAVPPVTTIYRPTEPLVAPEPDPVVVKPTETVTLDLNGRVEEVRNGKAVIGRSRECDLVLDDANVSRRHCEFVREGGSWFVVDLGSTNGTELNGRAVKRAQLADGDRVAVGSSEVVFGLVTT
jgi:hypothetical protein